LRRLCRLIEQGLERTRALWPAIRRAYGWIHRAAHILTNGAGLDAGRVARRYDGLTAAVARHRDRAGVLAGAVDHIHKVTRSYRTGLFACYGVPDLPRTNNDLERCFGAHRHHERRTTGRKAASPALVLRGSVRLIAATATRLRPVHARDLARADREEWAGLRRRLDDRRHTRTLGTRFRRNPQAYLSQLETQFLQPALPS
jgi:hypothetical protein